MDDNLLQLSLSRDPPSLPCGRKSFTASEVPIHLSTSDMTHSEPPLITISACRAAARITLCTPSYGSHAEALSRAQQLDGRWCGHFEQSTFFITPSICDRAQGMRLMFQRSHHCFYKGLCRKINDM